MAQIIDGSKRAVKTSKAEAWMDPQGDKAFMIEMKKDFIPEKFSRAQYLACK
jgi:hypothetical protein